jgi:N-acetyltransferase 10
MTLLRIQVSLLEENIKPRTDLPHLLVHLRERRPEKLHYIGVSFGLTLELFRFWKKHKFAPFYIGQIPVKLYFIFSQPVDYGNVCF